MARRVMMTIGWMAAAFVAVLAGLVAVSIIGDGVTGRQADRPLSEAEVAQQLANGVPTSPSAVAGPSSPTSNATVPVPSAGSTAPTSARPSKSSIPAATPAPSPGAPVSFRTRGGTVVARCAAGSPQLVSMSPAQGWSVHEQGSDEGEFRGVRDNHDRVKIDLGCNGDTPTAEFAGEGRRGDD